MNNLKPLNSRTAPKTDRSERIIRFGEGNFLRAFADRMVCHMNHKADFNASVVVVQSIEHGMADRLNAQDGLYHVNLRGKENGRPVNTYTRIDVVSRAINPYTHYRDFIAPAEQPEMRFVVSNTTEAGIAFDELMQTLDLPEEELRQFASYVMERFENPFVDHRVTSIMLNSFPNIARATFPG